MTQRLSRGAGAKLYNSALRSGLHDPWHAKLVSELCYAYSRVACTEPQVLEDPMKAFAGTAHKLLPRS